MAERTDLKTLEDDFSFLKDDPRVIGVLLFGSRVSGDITRGDYDLCVISPKSKPSVVLSEIYQHVDVHSKRYDVYTFEELPLYMKMGGDFKPRNYIYEGHAGVVRIFLFLKDSVERTGDAAERLC